MKIKYAPFLTILGLIFADFAAADWEYSAEGEGKFLYGYADVASKYKSYNKNNRAVSDMWLEFSARNEFSDDYEAAVFADFMGGTDKDYMHPASSQLMKHYLSLIKEKGLDEAFKIIKADV